MIPGGTRAVSTKLDHGMIEPFFLTILLPGKLYGSAFLTLHQRFSNFNFTKHNFLSECFEKAGVNPLLNLYKTYGPFLPVNEELETQCPGLYKFLLTDLSGTLEQGSEKESRVYPATNYANFISLVVFTMARHYHLWFSSGLGVLKNDRATKDKYEGASVEEKTLYAKRFLLLPEYETRSKRLVDHRH